MMEAPLSPAASLGPMPALRSNASASPAHAHAHARFSYAAHPHADPRRKSPPRPSSPSLSPSFSLSRPRQTSAFFDADLVSPRALALDLGLLSNHATRSNSTAASPHLPATSPNGSLGSVNFSEMHSPVLRIRRSNCSIQNGSGNGHANENGNGHGNGNGNINGYGHGHASIPRNVSDLSLGETLNADLQQQQQQPRHHRRRSTGAAGLTEGFGTYPSRRSSEDLTSHAADDLVVLTLDDVPKCHERSCSRHHHRQSCSSTVSIKCDSNSDEGSRSPTFTEPETDSAIAFEPMPAHMLVPLVERGPEMTDLLKHPTNRRLASLVEHVVGKDTYKNVLLPLWTDSDRDTVCDREWLRQSKKLLMRKSNDGRVWREFCGMVGWDEGVFPLDVDHAPFVRPGAVARKRSEESLNSATSHQMNIIREEEEEEEEEEQEEQEEGEEEGVNGGRKNDSSQSPHA